MASSGHDDKKEDEDAAPATTPKAKSRGKEEKKPHVQGERNELSAPRSRVSIRENGLSSRDKTGRRGSKKPSTGGGGGGMKKDSTMRGLKPRSDDRSNASKMGFVFQTPKDEYPLANLEVEGQLALDMKLMEEYKIGMQQVHNTLLMMMRRGNGTTDLTNITSEKHQSAPEKLNKDVVQTKNFWGTDKTLQPAMNESVAKNTYWLAVVERGLQDRGPRRMPKIQKFVYHHYPKYAELKKELSKVKKERPDSAANREEILKKIQQLVKEKYKDQKTAHLGELQSAFVELGMYHKTSASIWYQISQRKMPPENGYPPESFDFSQFFKPPAK